MRTIKPQAVTVLHAPFQHDGRIRLVFAVAALVGLDGCVVESEQTLWQMFMRLPGSRGLIDEIKPKVRGEALLSGYAFAPHTKPETTVAVRLEVGSVAKEIWAIGDRHWRLTGSTDPLPFERMPLSYAHAYGGEGFPTNPKGKGYGPVAAGDGRVHPLPNLEYPKKLVRSSRDTPPIACFGPVDPELPQRTKKFGTYDQKWFEKRYPEMAADFDPTYFNMAAEDQWIDGYWEGGEPFLLQNVHPSRAKIEGTVPKLRARLVVSRVGAEEGTVEDVRLRCDTLWFVPHEERVLMIFRGGVDVVDDEGSDLSEVVVALERPGEPRDLDHYREIRRLRLDKDMGALRSLRDADLLPPDLTLLQTGLANELGGLVKLEHLKHANARRRAQIELDGARAKLEKRGIDPDKHLPKEIPPDPKLPTREQMPAFQEELRAKSKQVAIDAETHKTAALAKLREALKKAGVDGEAAIEKALAKARSGGPPKFKAEEQLANLQKRGAKAKAAGAPLSVLEDPTLLSKLRQAELAAKDGYRLSAHDQPPPAELGEDQSQILRAQVEAALLGGVSLADRDLTGADLSGLDFTGVDLHGAFLEAAKLEGCMFKGANVTGVVFTRARLEGANFEGATAARANFGHADLRRAKLVGADLSHAVLIGANLSEADLSRACLDNCKLSDVKIDRTNLSEVTAEGLVLFKGDLRGADLRGAKLSASSFSNVDLSGADLSDASLFRMSLVDVKIEDARLRRTKMERVAFAKAEGGCSLARSDFRGADLRRINFRGVDLDGADLRETDLSDADFSKATLRGAKLEAARAVRSRWMGTELTDANFDRADLMGARMARCSVGGASFVEANLFRVDADRMRGDDRTTFKHANLKNVRVTPATRITPAAEPAKRTP